MQSVNRLEFMIYRLSLLGFDFHIPVDLSFLHRISGETCCFSLVIHASDSPLTEEISRQSSSDSRISMVLPPVLAQSAFARPKKTLKHFSPD